MTSVRRGSDSSAVESVSISDSTSDGGEMAGTYPADLSSALRSLLDGVARTLGVPLALLSRDRAGWRFEAEAFPARPIADAQRFRGPGSAWPPGSTDVTDQTGAPWTGLLAGQVRQREWLLMLPGSAERWRAVNGLESIVDRFGDNLEAAVRLDDERHLAALHRRLYAFVRRLTRISDVELTYRCILRTLAKEVGAQTAALATYDEAQRALIISATQGYPQSIVEHIRIPPGHGVIGRTFES